MPTLFVNFSAQQPSPRPLRHERRAIFVVNSTTLPVQSFPAITSPVRATSTPFAPLVTGPSQPYGGKLTPGHDLIPCVQTLIPRPARASGWPTSNCWGQRLLCRALVLTLVAWLTSACAMPLPVATPTPALVGSCTLALPATATDEARIRAVINAEGELVVKQEITALMGLWQEGAFIANAKNTPTDPADDQFWLDKDAIRHRYVRTVFPGAPASATPKDLTIAITGSTAVVTATTSIGNELSPAGDRWELVQQQGCWLLQSLTYNLERP